MRCKTVSWDIQPHNFVEIVYIARVMSAQVSQPIRHLYVTLLRGFARTPKDQKAVLTQLGFTYRLQTITKPNNIPIRGSLRKVKSELFVIIEKTYCISYPMIGFCFVVNQMMESLNKLSQKLMSSLIDYLQVLSLKSLKSIHSRDVSRFEVMIWIGMDKSWDRLLVRLETVQGLLGVAFCPKKVCHSSVKFTPRIAALGTCLQMPETFLKISKTLQMKLIQGSYFLPHPLRLGLLRLSSKFANTVTWLIV